MSNALEQARTQPLRQVKSVKQLLLNDNARDQLAAVAAKHMSPERMMRVVANAIRTTPKLQECDPMSFLGALMHCASMGLEPNTPLGHAYLIPFENKRKGIVEVQTVIGYKGFLDLSRRSGQVKSIHADVVYDDDELFSHEYGSNQHLRHKPGPRDGKKIGAYCHVKLNYGPDVEAEGHVYLNAKQILRIRDQFSQGWKTAVRFNKTAESPWTLHEDVMWAKTAVRAMANRGEIPMSVEFMLAMENDEKPMDYRAFAMNPTAGVTPVEDDFIEGETVETEPDMVEEKEPTKPAAQESRPSRAELQKQHREAMARPKPKEDPKPEATTPEPEQTAHDPETGEVDQADAGTKPTKPTEPTPEAIDPYQNAYATTVLKDVTDLGWGEALSFHDDKLEKLKESNSGLYAAIIAEARKLDSTVPDDA